MQTREILMADGLVSVNTGTARRQGIRQKMLTLEQGLQFQHKTGLVHFITTKKTSRRGHFVPVRLHVYM